MTDRYLEIATSDAVKQLQERWGSRSAYCRLETGPLTNNQLGPEEVAFIEAQDTFFLASVNEKGWPYIQHRGGPPGFLKVLAGDQLGFADFKGNRQYLSFGKSKISKQRLRGSQPSPRYFPSNRIISSLVSV